MPDTIIGGHSINDFSRRNGIGLSMAYKEIRAGRLIARKIGRRTIIFDDDERAWRDSLPHLKTAEDQEG